MSRFIIQIRHFSCPYPAFLSPSFSFEIEESIFICAVSSVLFVVMIVRQAGIMWSTHVHSQFRTNQANMLSFEPHSVFRLHLFSCLSHAIISRGFSLNRECRSRYAGHLRTNNLLRTWMVYVPCAAVPDRGHTPAANLAHLRRIFIKVACQAPFISPSPETDLSTTCCQIGNDGDATCLYILVLAFILGRMPRVCICSTQKSSCSNCLKCVFCDHKHSPTNYWKLDIILH